jgi:hypothetical protein
VFSKLANTGFKDSLPPMNATLNVELDADVLHMAEQEAASRKTTIKSVVERQLQIMALNWRDSQNGRTPLTDSLRGAVALPSGFDENREIEIELTRKHA